MALKTSQPFSETRNIDPKNGYSLFTTKESSSTNSVFHQWSRKPGSNKSAMTCRNTCVQPSRMMHTSNGTSVQMERKPALIVRTDLGNNSRFLNSKFVPSYTSQPDPRGNDPKVGVRVRKRKSCATSSRSRRPEMLLSFGAACRPDNYNEENGVSSRPTSINPCKKRVEFHSQTRLDKFKSRGISLIGAPPNQQPHDLVDLKPEKKDSNRYHVFSYEQVKRLDSMLQTQLCISPRPMQWDCGLLPGIFPEQFRYYSGPVSYRSSSMTQKNHGTKSSRKQTAGNCSSCHTTNGEMSHNTRANSEEPLPTQAERNRCTDPGFCLPIIRIPLKQLIRTIRDRLLDEQISVREIRLNGGAAGCVINIEQRDNYSDLDVIFSVDLSNSVTFTKIKSVVFSSIAQFLADTFACGNLAYSCTPNHCAPNSAKGLAKTSSPASATTVNNLPTGSITTAVNTAIAANKNGKSACTTTVTDSNVTTNETPKDNIPSAPGNELPVGDPKVDLDSLNLTNKHASNRSRTRCSHSFTSVTDLHYLSSSLSSSSNSFPLIRTACNRRASENSVLFPKSNSTQYDPLTCVTSSLIAVPQVTAYSTLSPVFGTNNLTSSACSNTNATMAMMMTFASCFLSAPFHSFPCAQNWSRLLRDESMIKQYIQKMVRIHKPSSKTADSWSLFTLGYRTPDGGKTVDVKFVDRMQRPFEFTVDSFQIVLDSLMAFYETSRQTMDEHFYPTVVAESVAGSFSEALSHLKDRLIATPRPEEIRGGGLLKYCKLLVDGYRPSSHIDVLSMERYMCSRFFIDFPDILSQHQRLTYYLTNHFDNNDATKATYLQILHEVVSHSTVCLMTHERQQTLCLIRMLLQDFLSRSEFTKTGVHLEEFSSDNWALDAVYYGTSYFPKQLYLLSEPIRATSSTKEMPSGCLFYADHLSPSITTDSVGTHAVSTECSSNVNIHFPIEQQNEGNMNENSTVLDLHSFVEIDGNPTVESLEENDSQKTSAGYPFTTHTEETKKPKCTEDPEKHIAMDTTLTPPPTDETENVTYNEQEYHGFEYPKDGESCFANTQPGSYDNSLMFYVPQVVTYFPTPMKYPKETEESENIQATSENFVCTGGITPKPTPHYHAGIILPTIESSGAAEMNHYVGVPCSEMQYAYSNFPCGIIDSMECVPYPPSMYCYSPDPGYLVYTNPVLQNSPTLILAYPI